MSDNQAEPIEPAVLGLSLSGKPLPEFTEPVSAPYGTTPLRRPGSVRRTMSIDVHWPDGADGVGHFLGRARDVLTLADGSTPMLLAQAETDVTAADRQIRSISATPTPERLQQLVGVRAGGYLRTALAEAIAAEKASASPLYLLLDDLAGATLVSRWAFTLWQNDWLERAKAAQKAARQGEPDRRSPGLGVCMGLRPGSTAFDASGQQDYNQNTSRVVALPNPADPEGWHVLPAFAGTTFRRARRIDVWREAGELMVETHFQDSGSVPAGGDRFAIHEYLLQARIDADGLVRTIDTTPGTLPYASCRAAPANNEVLIGTPVHRLREVVLEKLKRTAGCTHLNDTLRSLAETTVLAGHLPFG